MRGCSSTHLGNTGYLAPECLADEGQGRPALTLQESKHVVEARVESANARDMDRFLQLHSESVAIRIPGRAKPIIGRDALSKTFNMFLTAFPDFKVSEDRIFGEGECVCLEFVFTGTHKGAYPSPFGRSIPPTGRPLRSSECAVFRVKGGKIVEIHGYWDELGYLQQLGAAS